MLCIQEAEDVKSSASDALLSVPSSLEIDMSDQEITFDEVAATAKRLVNDGLPVTVGALRDTLGTAPLSSVHKHLATWRASQAKPAEALKVDIPESITAALVSWAQQLAEEARTGLRDGLAQADDDLASLLHLNEQLEVDREELRAQLAKVTEDRDQALATLAECDARIERLTVELQHARDTASDALVGKAKDQLAIEGKDAQLAALRLQLERNVAASSAESDARLAAEMELVGAVTARDNLAAEVKELRTQLDACRAGRRTS
jgi:chromosome segregation ATPase